MMTLFGATLINGINTDRAIASFLFCITSRPTHDRDGIDADRSPFPLKTPNVLRQIPSAIAASLLWYSILSFGSSRSAGDRGIHQRITQATWHLKSLTILPSTEAATIYSKTLFAAQCAHILSTPFETMLRSEQPVDLKVWLQTPLKAKPSASPIDLSPRCSVTEGGPRAASTKLLYAKPRIFAARRRGS